MNSRETLTDLAIRAAFMVVVYVVFAAAAADLSHRHRLAALLDGAVLIGVVSIGIGISMIAGEFDLSVGSLAAVTGVIAIRSSALASFPRDRGGAVRCGHRCAAGVVIAVTRDQLARLYNRHVDRPARLCDDHLHENTVTIPIEQLSETDFFAERFLGVLSPLSVGMFVVFVALSLFLRYSRWGREIFATGGGRNEARAAGVPCCAPW